MPYITREDGERFIIPSYRDVLTVKKPALLRREIMLLSTNYGEYITLQQKNVTQYEVAFSPEPGYLLGETVWHYFKRPADLIYCEAIPNTYEAILVIVKGGSVYLDGSFPLDAIADELVIFRTQQNNFEIYIHGDVPISQTPEDDKFSFAASSVKSFTELEKPVFPTLPTLKAFQLQLVDTVLKAKGIGVFPLRNVLLFGVILTLLWLAWSYFSSGKKEIPAVIISNVNPYQGYLRSLYSPDPTTQIHWLVTAILSLQTIPGWAANDMEYKDNVLTAKVTSLGARTSLLYAWAKQNNAAVTIAADGFHLAMTATFANRPLSDAISPTDKVIASIIDNVSYVLPGNNLSLGPATSRGRYMEQEIAINFNNIAPGTLDLIGQQLKNLPLVLTKVVITVTNGYVAGTINLKALGS